MLYVGCSGWQYRDWCGSLYPDRLPNDRWLAHYATAFPVVEINSTFYRLPQPKTVKSQRVVYEPAGDDGVSHQPWLIG